MATRASWIHGIASKRVLILIDKRKSHFRFLSW